MRPAFAAVRILSIASEAWEFLMAGGAIYDHLDYSFWSATKTVRPGPMRRGGGAQPCGGSLPSSSSSSRASICA